MPAAHGTGLASAPAISDLSAVFVGVSAHRFCRHGPLQGCGRWAVLSDDQRQLRHQRLGAHANNERCVIQVQRPGVLAIREFDVESHNQCGWDSVAVGGIKYCGTAGPAGVGVSREDTITWTSDFSITKSGWTICLE